MGLKENQSEAPGRLVLSAFGLDVLADEDWNQADPQQGDPERGWMDQKGAQTEDALELL